jgi:hypothetical protein
LWTNPIPAGNRDELHVLKMGWRSRLLAAAQLNDRFFPSNWEQ